jgi:phosphogluconate dehydratase
MLRGNLGEGIIKTSAVKPEHRRVVAPCRIFDTQEAFAEAFERGDLFRDMVAVVRFQGPRANGMPELHQLTPYMGVLQDKGHHVALLTDGRMSGASGKFPAAIHVSPEAAVGGPLARLRDGDIIELDSDAGILRVQLSAQQLAERDAITQASMNHNVDSLLRHTLGRNLFECFRQGTGQATTGATLL